MKIPEVLLKIHEFITRPLQRAPEQRRFHSIAAVYSWIGGIIYHFALIFIFFSIGVREMGIFNIFSVIFQGFAMLLGLKDRPFLAGVITTVEIIAHATAAIYFVGFGSGFQLFYLISISTFFTVPSGYRKPLFPVLIIVPALWIGMRVIMANRLPIYILPQSILTIIYSVNVFCTVLFTVSLIGFVILMAARALRVADTERRRADRLLLNILPEPIAERLKADESTIADGFVEASIFFCDIVNFTVMSSGRPPEEVVDILNELFSRIDGLLDEYSMEKIKTIGDAYMAVCGIPEPVKDHAYKAVSFAEAVQEQLKQFNTEKGLSMQLRYGVNSGLVVAGVIGRRKFIYDLWGDTVNTASRMESYGIPGRIQITPATKERLNGKCIYESRGEIDIKGKGMMETFLVSTVTGGACAPEGNGSPRA